MRIAVYSIKQIYKNWICWNIRHFYLKNSKRSETHICSTLWREFFLSFDLPKLHHLTQAKWKYMENTTRNAYICQKCINKCWSFKHIWMCKVSQVICKHFTFQTFSFVISAHLTNFQEIASQFCLNQFACLQQMEIERSISHQGMFSKAMKISKLFVFLWKWIC